MIKFKYYRAKRHHDALLKLDIATQYAWLYRRETRTVDQYYNATKIVLSDGTRNWEEIPSRVFHYHRASFRRSYSRLVARRRKHM